MILQDYQEHNMSLTINHQTDDISNLTGVTTFNGVAVGGDNTPKWYGSRAVMMAGNLPASASASNTIDYVTVDTTGDATDFGDLNVSRQDSSSTSNGTRGLNTGKDSDTSIDYITIASTGNAQDFGDLSVGRGVAAASNGTLAIFSGGWGASGRSNVIDTVTIATTGNATDFGDLTIARSAHTSCADNTRALFAGGLD